VLNNCMGGKAVDRIALTASFVWAFWVRVSLAILHDL